MGEKKNLDNLLLLCIPFYLQLGWAKKAGWFEDAIAGPGRPVVGPGRPRGRLSTNWAQRIALQQAHSQAELIKIPKKRGPKPGSKVSFFLYTKLTYDLL